GPPPGNSPSAGDPVDLATGLFVWQKTDLTLPDTLPLSLTRVYRPADTVSRAFGIGQTFSYDMYLYSQNQYTEVDLFLPDGGKVHCVRTSPGTSYVDAVFTAENTPTIFLGATMTFDEAFFGWRMKLRDGTVLSFPTYTPLTSIQDRNGNEITILRND